jgi:hypothetical protein
MSTESAAGTAPGQKVARPGRMVRVLAAILVAGGVIMVVAGAVTWFTVQSQLSDERITVAEDATRFAGQRVDGPLTALEQASVIERHALEASGGRTYSELDRDDPVRTTLLNASILRASLFTSVVAFGVAFMAMGVGVLIALIGCALLLVARQPGGPPAAAH